MVLYRQLSAKARLMSVLIGFMGFLCLWELAVDVGFVSSLLLPRPMAVAKVMVGLVANRIFWRDVAATVSTWLLGVLIGTFAGGVLGLLLAFNPYVWASVEPWVEFLRSLPSVVLIPLVSLFFGIGASSRLACATLVVLVLMLSSAASAVRATRGSYLRLAVAWRATPLQTILHFYLPATLSYLAIALRAGIPLALIVTVAADMLIATDSGIGRILMDAYAVFDMQKLYAGIFVVGLLGYLSVAIGSIIEKRTIHWSGA